MQNTPEQRKLRQSIGRRLERLESERKRGWESHWRDLAANFMPRRARFLDAGEWTNDGRVKNHLQDDVGVLALRTLASGMQSGLTSPARPWFNLTLQDADLVTNNKAVKEWLHTCYERMVAAFARSNFYDQIHMLYRELGVFGTGVMLVEEDHENSIRCRTLTAGEYALDVNSSFRVDTLYRRVRMTPRQVAQAWPDTCPERIKNMAERDNYEWLTILHAIEPNSERRPGSKRGDERPYRSIFCLIEGGTEILEDSGYFEFPALCPRWDTTASDIYGSSPAMDALADCRMLQKISEDGRIALEKEVNPPLLVVQGGLGSDVDTSPGALTQVPSLAQGAPSIQPLYQVKANLAALEQTKQQLKTQIREMFFNDLFLMITQVNQQMTATEVNARNSEKMLLLGPVLDRLRSELFQPLIERVFGILSRSGIMPPPPVEDVPELAGQEIKIEFISILAMAQKQAGIDSINQTVAFIGNIMQLSPDAIDKLNVDEAIDQVADMQGVPPKLIRSDDEVSAIRQERALQMQQQQQLEAAQQSMNLAGAGAKVAKEAQEAGIGDDIINRMVGGA